jgi:hypothetical protein
VGRRFESCRGRLGYARYLFCVAAAPRRSTLRSRWQAWSTNWRISVAKLPSSIPFELAGPGGSEAILERWGEGGRRWAVASLLLDFPFLVAYTALNLSIVERIRRRAVARDRRVLAVLARPVAVVAIGAGASDAVENAALLAVVARRGDRARAALARRAAQAKFAGLGALWTYVAASGAAR